MTPERMAALARALRPSPWVMQLCDAQRAVALSRHRWKAVTTSRRGGKTVGLIAECADKLEQCGRGEVVLFLAKTRDAAKELAWDKLQALAESHGLPWEFKIGDLRIETPRGGVLLLRGAEGADAEKERQKIRGIKLRHAAIDEAQSIASTIRRLLRETIEPALGELRGSCTIAGTPGDVMAGGWYNISHKHEGCEDKWERFGWTIRDNPFFPEADAYLAQVLIDNHWTVEHPTYQREYEGMWCADDSVQVYRYLASRNDVETVDGYELSWPSGIGQDFGQDDACSWTALTNQPGTEDVRGLFSFKLRGLKPSECADITGALVEILQPDILVGDGGNLGGNIYIDAINERLGERTRQQMVSAQKSEKRAYIELYNGDLRSGRVKFSRRLPRVLAERFAAHPILSGLGIEGCEPLTSEYETLPWANAARLKEHAGHDNHCSDGALYIWRHFSAYLGGNDVKQPEPERGTEEYQTWLMEQDTEQHQLKASRKWWEK